MDSMSEGAEVTDTDSLATPHNKAASAQADDEASIDPETLPIALRFVAGDVHTTFGEVRSVSPGYVFELDKPLDERSIRIYANDTLIAAGELVCVGDTLGVRICHLLAPPPDRSVAP